MLGRSSEVPVLNWSDGAVLTIIPAGSLSGNILVTSANGGASNSVPFAVNYGGPLLQLSVNDTPLQVNLTSPQVLDWIHWGRISATVPDRKAVTTPLISDYTPFSGPPLTSGSGFINFSWSDGQQAPSLTDVTSDLESSSTGTGFQVTVPADTSVKTLNLYVEVFNGQGLLQASLSDGSTAAIGDQSVIDSDTASKVYSIDFRAASPGQTLTVTFSSLSGAVGLEAATLTQHLPSVLIASPAIGQSFQAPATVPVSVSASQFDDAITDLKAVGSDSTVLDVAGAVLSAPWGPLSGGHYSITASATDAAGLSNTSTPAEFDVIGQGGTLSIEEDPVPASPINLDTQGAADWVLWGPVNTGDTIVNNPGLILARKSAVAPLISDYKEIGNHPVSAQVFAHNICFTGDQQSYCSGSEISVHGLTNGFEIKVAADTNPRTLELYVGITSGDGHVTAFLSDGSAPVASEVGGSGPPPPPLGITTLYTINYSAASSGQTLTVRFTLNSDQGGGQVSLIGAALSGPPVAPSVPGPQLNSITPGKAAVNTQVTLAGSNFGATQGGGTVLFGQTPAQVVNWNDGSITVLVPSLSDGSNVLVAVSTDHGISNSLNFSVPTYNVFPASLNLLVGQSASVIAKDSSGNIVTGLSWTAADPTIVSVSTDDPPQITGLAPGSTKVYAGDVPFPVTVYAGTALPAGTPIWSLQVGDGSQISNLVPAVPSDSGADVFALSGQTLFAISSNGQIAWQQILPFAPDQVIPDFSGSAVLKRLDEYVETVADGSCLQHITHKVSHLDQTTGSVLDLYQFSDQLENVSTFCDNGQPGGTRSDARNIEAVIPHPSGPVFIQDNALVTVIDPSAAQTIAAVTLDTSLEDGLGLLNPAPQIGQMIVAGDGGAYVPYIYTEVATNSPPFLYDDHLKLLRVAADGSNSTIELGTWRHDVIGNPTHVGLEPKPIITNADQGVAVFVNAIVNGTNHTFMVLASPDSAGSVTDVGTSIVAFQPALQREDGSYIGSEDNGQLDAVGLDATVLYQEQLTDATGNPVSVAPLYATAGGGAVATSTTTVSTPDPFFGDPTVTTTLGMLYTLDQNGNIAAQQTDTGAVLSWKGSWYGTVSAGTSAPGSNGTFAASSFSTLSPNSSSSSFGINKYTLPFLDLALTFWPVFQGNASGTHQPPTLLMTHMYPFPQESTGVSANQIKTDTRQSVPLNPKTDLRVTHTFLLNGDLSTVAFREAIEETSQAVGYIGHSLNVIITQEEGGTQRVVPVGLFMGTLGGPRGGGRPLEHLHLVIAPNSFPPDGLEFLLPEKIKPVYVDGLDIPQEPMHPRANVIFLGSCGSFSLPFQYWFNIFSTTKNHVLLVPSDAKFTGDFLEVPGGVARYAWILIAQELAQGKTVAQALDAANQTIHVPGLFKNEDGSPLIVAPSFKWVAVGDSKLRLRPTSK